ncbi:VanZ family protein [Patescibacteria group bacterium]
MTKRERFRLWVPVMIWAGVIFSFSSMRINGNVEFSWTDFVVKKTAHVIEYAVLYWLLFRAISLKGKFIERKYFAVTLVIAIFYALSDEWHQTFVPGREGTLRDVGFDTLGMLMSIYQVKRGL